MYLVSAGGFVHGTEGESTHCRIGDLMLRDVEYYVEEHEGTRTRIESGAVQHKLAGGTKVLPILAGQLTQAGSCEYVTGLV
jgi:hypothetical protein